MNDDFVFHDIHRCEWYLSFAKNVKVEKKNSKDDYVYNRSMNKQMHYS